MAKYKVKADAMLESIMPVFQRTIADDFERIESAIIASNFDELKAVGHKIKGNAGGYGFDDLGEMAKKLEEHAIGNDIQQVKDVFTTMKEYMGNVEIEYVEDEE